MFGTSGMKWWGYASLDAAPFVLVVSAVSRRDCERLLAEWRPADGVAWWWCDKVVTRAGTVPAEATTTTAGGRRR